jgi:hypothetical protein
MEATYSMHRRDEIYIHNFSPKNMNRLFERSRCRMEDNIKIDNKEERCSDMAWIH